MSEPLRIGVDIDTDLIRVAKVSHLLGRPEIVALEAHSPESDRSSPIAAATISMPDDEALVKTVRLPENRSQELKQRVYFELAQSLLEPEERFRFECLETGNRHQLGLIYRCELILNRARRLGVTVPDNQHLPPVALRSVALARAYKYFCKSEAGDLIGIALITDQLVSLAMMYHGKIVSLGNSSVKSHSGTESAFKPVAIALKTLVNFKLAALHDDGITIPLAALLVVGDAVGQPELNILQSFFSARVAPCTPDSSLQEQVSQAGFDRPERFLVALGLTLN
jgi:hypothetical protein